MQSKKHLINLIIVSMIVLACKDDEVETIPIEAQSKGSEIKEKYFDQWKPPYQGLDPVDNIGFCSNLTREGGRKIWAISNTKNKLYQIDYSSGTPKTCLGESSCGLDTRKDPSRMTIDDKGRIWVANRQTDSVTCYDAKNKACFSSPHINLPYAAGISSSDSESSVLGLRAISSERVDSLKSNIYVVAYNKVSSMPTLFRITVIESEMGSQYFVRSFSITYKNGGSVTGYGAVFSQKNKLLWLSDRRAKTLVAIKDLQGENPSIAKAYHVDKCSPYGIALDDTDEMPLLACLDIGFIKAFTDTDTLLLFKHKDNSRARGIASDIFGHAWVTLDESHEVARFKTTEACASMRISMACDTQKVDCQWK